MKLDTLTLIEAQIGFYSGVLVGVVASWVFILFFVNWAWYFKLFSSIGEVGMIGLQALALRASIQARRDFLEARREFGKKEI